MQIKTIARYHLTPVRKAIVKNPTTNKCWPSSTDGRKETGAAAAAAVWRLLNLPTELPRDPAIPRPGTHPEKTKPLARKDTCTPVLTPAASAIAYTETP